MKCVGCDSELKDFTENEEVLYRGKKTIVNGQKLACVTCGEELYSAEFIQSISGFKKEVDSLFLSNGIISPSSIKTIRKDILGMTEKEASEYFELDITAFNRYESGELNIDYNLSKVLELLTQNK